MTGVKCETDKTMITNLTCKLKAVKGKHGVFTLKITPVKPLTDVKMHFKLYYKFGNAIYRPWMIGN